MILSPTICRANITNQKIESSPRSYKKFFAKYRIKMCTLEKPVNNRLWEIEIAAECLCIDALKTA